MNGLWATCKYNFICLSISSPLNTFGAFLRQNESNKWLRSQWHNSKLIFEKQRIHDYYLYFWTCSFIQTVKLSPNLNSRKAFFNLQGAIIPSKIVHCFKTFDHLKIIQFLFLWLQYSFCWHRWIHRTFISMFCARIGQTPQRTLWKIRSTCKRKKFFFTSYLRHTWKNKPGIFGLLKYIVFISFLWCQH